MSTKPYRPISAAEGDFFIAAQCGACTKRKGCRIVRLTMMYAEDDPKYPKEWVSDADGNNPRCTAREVTLAMWAKSDPREGDDMSKWPEPRPIAEAPRTTILAWFPGTDMYNEGWEIVFPSDEGWSTGREGHQPTHFLPLPPAPEVRK